MAVFMLILREYVSYSQHVTYKIYEIRNRMIARSTAEINILRNIRRSFGRPPERVPEATVKHRS